MNWKRVAPFGLPARHARLSTKRAGSEEISLGSGVRGTAVIMRRDDLLAALGDAPVVQLSEGG